MPRLWGYRGIELAVDPALICRDKRYAVPIHPVKAGDIVLVWKLDRLGRSLRHLLNTLVEFESLGIALVSMRENLDLSVPAGRLMFQIIGAMAEFERELIRERVTSGMRHAKSLGIHVGRPSVPVDAAKIQAMRASGLGFREIAAELKVSVGTLQQAQSLIPPSQHYDCGTVFPEE